MSDKNLKLEKIGLKPRTVGVEESAPEVHGDDEVREVFLESHRLRGPRGAKGEQGRRGRRGIGGLVGPQGDQGVRGLVGPQGVKGVDGANGLPGEHGRQGAQGPRGERGPVPRHKWAGTKLSFEQPDGSFGSAVNLQGPAGGRGMSGKGSAHNEGYSSISLVGTDLIFARDKAGPLGPDVVVDLSGIAGGSGGFAGLGPWRYRTETGTPPNSGQVRFNNSDPESATEVYIHETNSNSEDLANFLNLLEAGDLIYVQDQSDASKFILIEVASNTDSGTYRTIVPAQIAQQGAAISQNTTVNLVMSVAGGGAGSVVTSLTTAGDGDDITLTQTSGGNQVADTSDFLWKLGKAGGQVAIGGTGAGEELVLQGSTDADRGRVVARGGLNLEWDWTTDSDVTAMRIANTIPASGNLISANIFVQNTIGVNNGVFIMSALDDASQLTWSVSPGFAVTTLFFARQSYRSSTAGVAPAQSFTYAAQSSYWLTGAGDVTTSNYRALSFAPIIRVDNSGDRQRITNTVGVYVGPLYNTRNANSTADFGTIRGVHMNNAATVFLGQALGTEICTNWIGLDVAALTGLTVSGVRAAVRSSIASGASNYLLQNLGGAQSDFGAGDAHFNDSTWITFGNTVAAPDAGIQWDGSNLIIQPQSVPSGARVEIPNGGLLVEGDVFPVSDFIRRAPSTNLVLSSWRLTGQTTGDMADGFGTALFWTIEDDAAVKNNIAYQSCERAGADNSGLFRQWVYTAGVANEIFNCTADGFEHTAANLGFYSTAPVAQPAAVAVTAAGIHAALVTLGLIT